MIWLYKILAFFGYTEPLKLGGKSRSPLWDKKRKEILSSYPFCSVCGKTKKLIVHHKKPFHIFPELELTNDNLIVLCEAEGMNCHITFGHLSSWQSYNPKVEEDVIIWRDKIINKPK